MAEIEPLDLIDILPAEASIGKISLRDESRDSTITRSTSGTK
jgi:hypothetical protein